MTKPCPFCRGTGSSAKRNSAGLLLCHACKSAYWETSWDAREVLSHYEPYYSSGPVSYDLLTGCRYRAILNRFEEWKSPGRLLDVGCGAGHFLTEAEARGWQASGLEVSRSGLDILKRVKEEGRFKFSIIEGHLEDARFPAESFDAITLFEVIEHLEEPSVLLREVHRLLTKKGILYLTTPNYGSLSRIILGNRWRVVAEEHRCLATTKAIRFLLKELGFQPIALATKNIDLSEIMKKMRPQPSNRKNDENQRVSSSQRLRHRIENVPFLRWSKTAANYFLRMFHRGDTLEVFALK